MAEPFERFVKGRPGEGGDGSSSADRGSTSAVLDNPSLAGRSRDRSRCNAPRTPPLSHTAPMAKQIGKARLLGSQGCGNAIVEAAYAVAGVPLEIEEVDYSAGSPTRARLLEVNPLGQVPALVLEDGTVLTESLAMLHHLQDV